jgi:hypothetical protein
MLRGKVNTDFYITVFGYNYMIFVIWKTRRVRELLVACLDH